MPEQDEADWDQSITRRIGLQIDWKRRWGAETDFVQGEG